MFLALSFLVGSVLASECPQIVGKFDCPALANKKFPQPPYKIDAHMEKRDGVEVMVSSISISPGKKVELITDGKPHTPSGAASEAPKYTASCAKGVLTNSYSTPSGKAETKISLTKSGDLKVDYDFAKGESLICKKMK